MYHRLCHTARIESLLYLQWPPTEGITMTNRQFWVLKSHIRDPGCFLSRIQIFPSRIQDLKKRPRILDPYWIEVFLTQHYFTKLSDTWSGMFIPALDSYPGSRSRIWSSKSTPNFGSATPQFEIWNILMIIDNIYKKGPLNTLSFWFICHSFLVLD